MAKQTEFDYRTKATELERIITQLQDPDIQIDEAVKLHALGRKLASELETYLAKAEIEIKKHVNG